MRNYTYNRPATEEEKQRMVKLYQRGHTVYSIAELMGRSPSGVHYIVRKLIPTRKPGRNHRKDVHIVVDGVCKTFPSRRDAANYLGISLNAFRSRSSRGRIEYWSPSRFRAHPGLDSMPTPRPFETFSRETYELRASRGSAPRDRYVTITYEQLPEYYERVGRR